MSGGDGVRPVVELVSAGDRDITTRPRGVWRHGGVGLGSDGGYYGRAQAHPSRAIRAHTAATNEDIFSTQHAVTVIFTSVRDDNMNYINMEYRTYQKMPKDVQ